MSRETSRWPASVPLVNAKRLGGPGEREGGSVELLLGHILFVEVSLADDEEVARRVVARRGVACKLGRPQLVDVPVAVDADVISDVDPPLLALVVLLVLAQASGCVAVVAEDRGRVVDRHAGDGVRRAAGLGGWAPQASRHNITPEAATIGVGMGVGDGMGAGGGLAVALTLGRRCCSGAWCGTRTRAGADGRCQANTAGEPEQPTTADEIRAAVGLVGRKCVHDGHDTEAQ